MSEWLFSFSAIIYRSICFNVIATLQKNDNDKKQKQPQGVALRLFYTYLKKKPNFAKLIFCEIKGSLKTLKLEALRYFCKCS